MKLKLLLLVMLVFGLTSCGPVQSPSLPSPGENLGSSKDVVVKARATFTVSTAPGSKGQLHLTAVNGSVPVTVVNAASTSMTLDTSQFAVPGTIDGVIDLGFLNISALKDNNLNVCGDSGNQKCANAIIRLYTTGTNGPGIWNDTDQFGAPLTAGSPAASVGLGVANAAVLQTFAIPTKQHVVHLNDFAPVPHYDVQADFTDAGAGSYTTTLVLEYALTL